MMDSTMTIRPQLTRVEVPTADGGSRLEMRWDVPPALEAARHDPRRLTQRGTPGLHPIRRGASSHFSDLTPHGTKRTVVLFCLLKVEPFNERKPP